MSDPGTRDPGTRDPGPPAPGPPAPAAPGDRAPGAAPLATGHVDPGERDALAARASVEPASGAVRGDDRARPQPSSWEAAKIDLATEAGVRAELARDGRPAASAADEAFHGRSSRSRPPSPSRSATGRRCARPRGSRRCASRSGTPWARWARVDGARMLPGSTRWDGIDCQSCAWPDPSPASGRAFAEYCENGAKVTAEENTRRLIPDAFFREHSVAELSSVGLLARAAGAHRARRWCCARRPRTTSRSVGRRVRADRRRARRARVARRGGVLHVGAHEQRGGVPLSALRAAVRHQQPADCSNMCHESSGAALTDSIGIGKGTVTLEGRDAHRPAHQHRARTPGAAIHAC
jgi:hypothetical protein